MRVARSHHMNDEQIEQYSMGSMPEEECEQFEEHLLICEPCQTRVTEVDQFVSAMAAAGKELRRQPLRQRWGALFSARWTPMLAAACAVIVLAAVGIRLMDRGATPAAITVNLRATRGAGIVSKAPAGIPLQLGLDLADLPQLATYQVTVVDESGREQWGGTVHAGNGAASAPLPKMNGGVYFVRVYGNSGNLLREYGLELTGK
jgi:hypothetical protein